MGVEFGGGWGLLVPVSGYWRVCVGCEQGTCEGCGRSVWKKCMGYAVCVREDGGAVVQAGQVLWVLGHCVC